MRSIMLAIVVVVGLLHPACAQDARGAAQPVAQTLPLFVKNRCAELRDAAEQLVCADVELNAASARLSGAVSSRLNRIADRGMAVEENVEWIRNRNASCGIFSSQPIQPAAFASTKACLLKAIDGRIAILADPNFDCLAAPTTAGLLICSDPALAVADKEINSLVVGLLAKLRDDEVKGALAEYARWTRIRDRLCDLDDKDNVPLEELAGAERCLADYMKQKVAEIAAAKGDPKRLFGRELLSPAPDADAVDLCVGRIHSANTCENFLRISRVTQLDTEASARDAIVTAEIEMKVLAPFGICSPIASACTGSCWDLQSGQPSPTINSRQLVPVAYRIRVVKTFAFKGAKGGDWQCGTETLRPLEEGLVLRGP